VRNDFRAAYLRGRTGSPFDRASPYERYVAEAYGTGGVPAPRTVVKRPTVRAYFTDGDGQGLADRTQRRFFSQGTLPEDAIVDRDTTARDVLRAARASLTYASPALPRLELGELGRQRHVVVTDDDGTKRRQLGYVRVSGRVRFFLDGGVHADAARALLPEIAGYASGLLDHLLRAGLQVKATGREVTITLEGAGALTGEARVRVFGDDVVGGRKELTTVALSGGQVTVKVPSDVKRVAAVMRASDAAGPFVAIGEAQID